MTVTHQSQPKYGRSYTFNKRKSLVRFPTCTRDLLSSPKQLGLPWGPDSLILNGNQGFLPGNKAAGCDAEYHLHLVSKIRVSEDVNLQPPHTKHSWCIQGHFYVGLFSNLLLREYVYKLVDNNLRLLALHLTH